MTPTDAFAWIIVISIPAVLELGTCIQLSKEEEEEEKEEEEEEEVSWPGSKRPPLVAMRQGDSWSSTTLIGRDISAVSSASLFVSFQRLVADLHASKSRRRAPPRPHISASPDQPHLQFRFDYSINNLYIYQKFPFRFSCVHRLSIVFIIEHLYLQSLINLHWIFFLPTYQSWFISSPN